MELSVGMDAPAHPVGVEAVAVDLLSLPGMNIESELRPAMLDTRMRSGAGTVARTYNSEVLGPGVPTGAVDEWEVGITLRHQVRS